VNQIINWVLTSVDSVAPIPRTLLASLFIMLETSFLVGLIVPGDTVVLLASTGIDGVPEYVFMIVMVMFGSLLGETIGFFVGKYFGPRIRRSWIGRKLGEHRWEAVENYIDRRGGIAVFLSRFLPVLHSLVPLTVGTTRMSYRVFITWTAVACALWTGAYVTAAALLKNQYFELAKKYDWAGWAIIGVVIALMLTVYLVKKRVEKHEERFMDAPGDGDPNTIDDPLGS
jgi:membrane-associated protein